MYLTLFKFPASIPRCRVFHPEAGVKVADFLSNFASLETLYVGMHSKQICLVFRSCITCCSIFAQNILECIYLLSFQEKKWGKKLEMAVLHTASQDKIPYLPAE